MGVSLEQYRASIGSFNISKLGLFSGLSPFTMIYFWLLFLNVSLLLVQMLLIISGNVHLNPGPYSHKLVPTKSKFLSLCHINVRSIRLNSSLFNLKLELIRNEMADKFDILTLSETWLTSLDNIDNYLIDNFHPPFILNRVGRGGGVLCYVRNSIKVLRKTEYECQGLEALWLEVRANNYKFNLCTVYKPPNFGNEFWQLFQESIDMVKTGCISPIIIAGDLNSDPLTLSGRKLSEFAVTNDLDILIKEATRITSSSSSILDQFLTNIPSLFNYVNIEPPLATNDHCTISASIKLSIPIDSTCYVRRMWDFKNANFDMYRQSLNETNWDVCFHPWQIIILMFLALNLLKCY